ncbi:sensor histidine kinase [Ovoidimarina sediminis]|uniref:sensor histidine kinase n=1 Tax=Ovoidimarina sediminis TaxID=3079856 RepID=UPI0029115A9B|nr:sensor histidine kinase [Rhodophyticola sp. MJ-SS7]MDU8945430.1 sensor histidine kinase [Rhodophyticola sp. MJ-SS7]
MTQASLRLRLFLIILLPLLVIAAAIGVWQVSDARKKAAEVFDRSLLTTALAIAADVARSNGDAISLETRDRLTDTSGGPVFYHVYAPDGVFVTGYATPPVPSDGRPPPEAGPEAKFFNGLFHGRNVRVLKLHDITTIGGYSGVFTYTVWQDVDLRNAFVRDLSTRTFVVIFALTGTVAMVVWFGVNLGLRPLLDLEDAISSRSSSDLRPIQRKVPAETRGLVSRLNSLFGQVEAAMQAQNEFISNAAHQLRNPIAGVLAMAEAVKTAPSEDAARSRADELLSSARHAKDLANKLLTLERIKADSSTLISTSVDVNSLVVQVAESFAAAASRDSVAIVAHPSDERVAIVADEVMVREAITNLADNALRHGGSTLSRIDISVSRENGKVRVDVADDGRGVEAKDVPVVLSRFGQASPGAGSGLGLSIAEAIADRHGGRLALDTGQSGLTVSIEFPAGDQRPIA